MNTLKKRFKALCEARDISIKDEKPDDLLTDKYTQFVYQDDVPSFNQKSEETSPQKKRWKKPDWIGEKSGRPWEFEPFLKTSSSKWINENGGFPCAIIGACLAYSAYKRTLTESKYVAFLIAANGVLFCGVGCTIGLYQLVGRNPLDCKGGLRKDLEKWKDEKKKSYGYFKTEKEQVGEDNSLVVTETENRK